MMIRSEGEPISKEDKVLIGIGLATIVVSIATLFQTALEYDKARVECIELGMVDESGHKLEGFVNGRGCERFLVNNRSNWYLPLGSMPW